MAPFVKKRIADSGEGPKRDATAMKGGTCIRGSKKNLYPAQRSDCLPEVKETLLGGRPSERLSPRGNSSTLAGRIETENSSIFSWKGGKGPQKRTTHVMIATLKTGEGESLSLGSAIRRAIRNRR